MKIVLAGGKKITYYLAKNLISKGMAITIINKDKAFCEEMAKTLKALIIHGDASNLLILKKAEIFDNDIIVALTTRDQDNLIICELASKVLKVGKVFSLINDSENEQVFRKLGITNIINMSEIFSSVIEQRLSSYPIINLMPFEEGKALVIQIEVEEGFPIVGKMVKDLPF
ncbi:MAG: TrkA family potassium uptake protein, partial [Thermotogota bacterium]|nr:TrkA family potassium uptake protein [Thermotogota bacterium]